jgi:hypothetical protein
MKKLPPKPEAPARMNSRQARHFFQPRRLLLF